MERESWLTAMIFKGWTLCHGSVWIWYWYWVRAYGFDIKWTWFTQGSNRKFCHAFYQMKKYQWKLVIWNSWKKSMQNLTRKYWLEIITFLFFGLFDWHICLYNLKTIGRRKICDWPRLSITFKALLCSEWVTFLPSLDVWYILVIHFSKVAQNSVF